jgi:hypothetical protein
MTMYKEFKVGGQSGSPFGFFGPLLALAIIFTVMFFVAKGVFTILSWVAPVLLLATLIIDHKVVLNYFSFIFKLLKENTVVGVVAVVVTFFAYPFVAGFLFLKALGARQLKKMTDRVQQETNTYADYEEVKEEPEDFLELPQTNSKPKEPSPQQRPNDYDDMFK